MDARIEARPSLASRITPGGVAIAAALLLAAWMLPDVLLLAFFAVLLACALRGAAEWVAARTKLPIRPALALVVLALVLLAAAVANWIEPRLLRQGEDLVARLSAPSSPLRQAFAQTPWLGSLARHVSPMQGAAGPHLAAPAEAVLGVSFTTLAGGVVLIVTTLYLAASPDLYVRGALHLVPVPHRPRAHAVMRQVGHALRYWLLGQLVDMVAVGVLASAGLAWVGVPVPFALGVLSGLLTFVPYFGAIVAAVPAVAVALTVGWTTALWALGVYTVCHCVEGYIIGPLVQRRLVELPPALTVMAMTAAGSLFGALGIVLGTPLAAAGLVVVRMLYVGDVLGDCEVEPDA